MTRDEYLHELKEIAQLEMAIIDFERKRIEIEKRKRERINKLLESMVNIMEE